MRTNAAGIKLVASFEGLRLKAYRATPGERYLTIGYGHYGPDVKPGQTITRKRALLLLKKDLRTAERAVDKYVKVGLGSNRFAALVSFCFNVGTGNFRSSTLVRKLNKKAYGSVPGELMRWTKAGGVVYDGLVRRRKAEGRLWNRRA